MKYKTVQKMDGSVMDRVSQKLSKQCELLEPYPLITKFIFVSPKQTLIIKAKVSYLFFRCSNCRIHFTDSTTMKTMVLKPRLRSS